MRNNIRVTTSPRITHYQEYYDGYAFTTITYINGTFDKIELYHV